MAAAPPPPPLSPASPTRHSASNTIKPAEISSRRTAQVARHLSSASRQPVNMAFQIRKVAPPNTLEHRVYIEKDGVPVSPFHDIPLYANADQTILNMVVEIPRWTNAKLEVSFCRRDAREEKREEGRYTDADRRAITDLQGRAAQPYQAGHQEGQAPLRP